MAPSRTRYPRGEGDRLRADIIEAASNLLINTGDPRRLTLRGVAKLVGIAATSVYLHFPDVEHLAIAVAERRFEELTRQQQAIEAEIADPGEALLARCRAYCRFALENPGHYRVMFIADLGPSMNFGFDQAPGRAAFEALVGAVRRCLDAGAIPPHDDPFRLAALVWAAEHGLVSLRMTRPRFPWPPIDEMVDEAVSRLLGLPAT
jgi:AcrR family transcriptional regulator